MPTRHATPMHPTHRAGFTLMELLVVVAIIGVLVGLAMTVGSKVTQNARKNTTQQTIASLDHVLEAYIKETEQKPPAYILDPTVANNGQVIPMLDGVTQDRPMYVLDSLAFFLLEAKKVPACASIIATLPTKFTVRRQLDPWLQPSDPSNIFLTTIVDAWSKPWEGRPSDDEMTKPSRVRPIRFVHPAFDGAIYPQGGPVAGFVDIQTHYGKPLPTSAIRQDGTRGALNWGTRFQQIRRTPGDANNPADADAGKCPSGSPYFYSDGPDDKPNDGQQVYTLTPTAFGK